MPTIGKITVRSRAYFSTSHLRAAEDFATKCLAIEQAHPAESRFDDEHRGLVLAAVIESGAFLEALVNELFKDCVEDHASYTKPLGRPAVQALREQWERWHAKGRAHVATLTKFDCALEYCRAAAFEKDRAPHQDATALIDLRNALVHYTPEWVSADERHRFDSLKSRFPQNALMAASRNAYFPDKCLGAGCAVWAAASARAYATDFCTRLGIAPNYQSSRVLKGAK